MLSYSMFLVYYTIHEGSRLTRIDLTFRFHKKIIGVVLASQLGKE
jgi:hypothetical protein